MYRYRMNDTQRALYEAREANAYARLMVAHDVRDSIVPLARRRYDRTALALNL